MGRGHPFLPHFSPDSSGQDQESSLMLRTQVWMWTLTSRGSGPSCASGLCWDWTRKGAVSPQLCKDQSHRGPDTHSSGGTLGMQKLAGQEEKQMMVSIQGTLFLPAVGRTAFPVQRSWQDARPPLPLAAHRLGVCHGNPRAWS